MNDANILTVFEILKDKYVDKEDTGIFERIYNILLEDLSKSQYTFFNYSKEIDKKRIDVIYDFIMMRKEINIKEKVLEGFLVKILLFYSNNFEKVESYLLKAGDRVTPKIIETLILEYFKVSYYLNKLGDTFSVYSMILLTKSGRIHIKYTDINLNADILQRIRSSLFSVMFFYRFCHPFSNNLPDKTNFKYSYIIFIIQ